MMNNEFTIMLIACLCTVTTIVVVMFINITCAFQEKLEEQEEIIKSEKIIHLKREEEQERKFLKKQVDYEKKLERAFALIETCNSKINELVLLNKESADKQQIENMLYCNKMHCQILARQDDESERCTELFQEIQTINIKNAEQEKIRSKSYITFCAIVPNFGSNEGVEEVYPFVHNKDYVNLYGLNWCNIGYNISLFSLFNKDDFHFTRVENDILNNKIYIFDAAKSHNRVDGYDPLDYHKRNDVFTTINFFNNDGSNSNLKQPTLVCDEIEYNNPYVIPIGSMLSGEISKYFPENTYVVNYVKDATYAKINNINRCSPSECLHMTTVILSNNRIKKYPVSMRYKQGDDITLLRDKCYIDGSFI